VVSSYTPTISALQRARRPVLNPSSQPLNVLLVSESAAPGVSRLYHVQAELERITNVMRRTDSVALTTVSNPATVDNVSTNIPAAQIVHMACHGVQNWDDALDSGFCLRDGDLTISALMKLKLDNGLLAFLSACETAKGDQRQPDQIIHLAAAMLFAGFRNVIATLW
jgi:CHAT domain-containing protein